MANEEAMTHIKHEQQVAKETPARAQASSGSWEGPITDSQAAAVSDYLLNEQETKQDYSEEEEEPSKDPNGLYINMEIKTQVPESGPSWESLPAQLSSHEYPRDLEGYVVSGESAYDAYWQTWLAEIIGPPPTDRYYW